jgi:uncharacterized protein (DUF1684 family)
LSYAGNVLRLACAGLLVLAAACAQSPADEDARFLRDLQEFRAAKDAAFLDTDSPVPPDKRQAFLPLAYYPPSTEYRAPAVLQISGDGTTVEMPTSTGQRRTMRVVGTLAFTLRGQPLSLGAFVDTTASDLSRLFVPFTDLTSGTETYPAGRYLDLDVTRTGIYVIDFNRAYNPYCYYNPAYDCPFPPRSNRLQVPVRAGEKVK